MIRLGVNVDHVATLRQARYREMPDSPNAEPDPVEAALVAERAGAEGITAHLRSDRRHVGDGDIYALREKIATKLNLEMGCSGEILKIALKVRPEEVCLVPENRQEVTTEGGLDCAGQEKILRPLIGQLQDAGIVVSLFIDPDEPQIAAAAALGAEFVELHTGAYCDMIAEGHLAKAAAELDGLRRAATLAHSLGLEVHAGHGIGYDTVTELAAFPEVMELNIGHFLIGEAIFRGLGGAIEEMRRKMDAAREGQV